MRKAASPTMRRLVRNRHAESVTNKCVAPKTDQPFTKDDGFCGQKADEKSCREEEWHQQKKRHPRHDNVKCPFPRSAEGQRLDIWKYAARRVRPHTCNRFLHSSPANRRFAPAHTLLAWLHTLLAWLHALL